MAPLCFLYLDHKQRDIYFVLTFNGKILMQTHIGLKETCCVSDFNETSIWPTDFCKSPRHNVTKNQFSGSTAVPNLQTRDRKDMKQLTVAVSNILQMQLKFLKN